jgi:hypothetical protein
VEVVAAGACSALPGRLDLQVERRVSRQPFRSVDHYLDFFRTNFGPIKMAFERVPGGKAALEADLPSQLEQANTAGDRDPRLILTALLLPHHAHRTHRTPFIGPPRMRVRGWSVLSMAPARRLA